MSGPTLEELLGCSERMLAAARASRWEELATLEAERQAVMRGFAPADVGPGSRADMVRLLEINAEIIALGEARREELMRSFSSHRRRRRAADAYSDPPA